MSGKWPFSSIKSLKTALSRALLDASDETGVRRQS